MPLVNDLRAQQTWFAEEVMARSPSSEGARLLTRGPRLASAERLEIYRDGYRARLAECLADDYPAVQHLLGEATFEAVAIDYVDAHPSRSPSLNAFGRHMADFLAKRRQTFARFAADLARLEWALVQAIHAAPGSALTLDRFEDMSPEQWASATFAIAPSAQVLRFDHPANRYYVAFREGTAPSTVPAPEASATLIHRQGWIVWRRDLTPPMARLLEAIAIGTPLGEALARAITDEDEGTQANVTHWFRDWVSSEVFTALVLP